MRQQLEEHQLGLGGSASFQAGQGNAGVAQTVSSTNGAIGYVDFSDAKAANLKFASIKNSCRHLPRAEPGGRRGRGRVREDRRPTSRTAR